MPGVVHITITCSLAPPNCRTWAIELNCAVARVHMQATGGKELISVCVSRIATSSISRPEAYALRRALLHLQQTQVEQET